MLVNNEGLTWSFVAIFAAVVLVGLLVEKLVKIRARQISDKWERDKQ